MNFYVSIYRGSRETGELVSRLGPFNRTTAKKKAQDQADVARTGEKVYIEDEDAAAQRPAVRSNHGVADEGGGVVLPEDPWRYFQRVPGAVLVDLEKLRPIRARPKGIANAARYMRMAYDGEMERRKPISIAPAGDGTYTVCDGNSTFANATAAGWRQIPALIFPKCEEEHRNPAWGPDEYASSWNARRRYSTEPAHDAAAIMCDVARYGRSRGWSGDVEDVEAVKRELRKFNIGYTDDMFGEWGYIGTAANPRGRRNPTVGIRSKITEASYPSVFGDSNHNTIPDVDDPYPFTEGCPPGADRCPDQIEETRLSDTIRAVLAARQEYEPAMQAVVAKLESVAPGSNRLSDGERRMIGVGESKVGFRVKTPYSTFNKLVRGHLLRKGQGPLTPKHMTDMAGTMVVADDFHELKAAEAVLERNFGILEKKDYYAKPKAGYRAIHFIVESDGLPVEVQLLTARTLLLKQGSHTPYKEGRLNAAEMDRLSRLVEAADKGDARATREIDALLAAPHKLEAQLTLPRSNPLSLSAFDENRELLADTDPRSFTWG